METVFQKVTRKATKIVPLAKKKKTLHLCVLFLGATREMDQISNNVSNTTADKVSQYNHKAEESLRTRGRFLHAWNFIGFLLPMQNKLIYLVFQDCLY